MACHGIRSLAFRLRPPRVVAWLVHAAVVTVVVATAITTVGGTAGAPVAGTPAGDGAVATPDPVLLVHGFDGSASSWHVMRDRLRAAGYRDNEVAAISYDSTASSVTVATQIAAAVDDLIARTGAARVDLISHSLGAIASRYYVTRLGGDARIDAWVSLAGTNQGTYWAYGCAALTSCRDMEPGSEILTELTSLVPAGGAVRYGTWWSPCDPMIIPSRAATLTGARNTETACLGHSDLKTDPTVFAQVQRFLRGAHRSSDASRPNAVG